MITLSVVVLLFFIYSFIGWVLEVLYCSSLQRQFINRGFLYGPLCPIYGFGGLLVIFLLKPFTWSVPLLFFMSILVTSLLEYISSWILEKIFATKWWDYSQYKFNIHGRICLLNSLLFGIAGTIAVYFVHPSILHAVMSFSPLAQNIVASILAGLLFVDFSFTLRSLVDFSEKLSAFTEFIEHARSTVDFREWFNETDLKVSLERLRERYKIDSSERNARLLSKLESIMDRSKSMRRLIRSFPRMKSSRNEEHLSMLKRLYSRIKK